MKSRHSEVANTALDNAALDNAALVGKINLSSVAAFVGLVVVAIAGAVWTGMAVSEGATAAMLVRFVASIAGGLYYLTLFRLATGRRFFQTAP